MRHHNEREGPITVGNREVTGNVASVAGFVGNVLNIGELIVLKIGLTATDF